MKFYFTITAILICLFSSNLFSQKIDSLFSNCLFYNDMYDDGSVVDSAFVANLFNKIDSTQGSEKVGLLFKAMNGYYFNRPDISRELSQQALDIAFETEDDSLIAYAYHYHGLSYEYLQQHRMALKIWEKGLATDFAKITYNYRSWLTFNSGICYFELGKPDTAAKLYYEAIRLNEFVGNVAFASKVHLELCRLFASTGNYEQSIFHFDEGLKRIDLEKDKKVASELYTERFKVELENQNLDSANSYFDLALQNGIALNDSAAITNTYYQYGQLLFNHEYYQESLQNYLKGIQYVNRNTFQLKYYSFIHGIGKAYLYLGNEKLAQKYLFEAKEGIKFLKYDKSYEEFELTLAKLYAKLGDWNNFIAHFSKAEEFGFLNLKESELAAINELKTVYETEQKDRKIEHQDFQISAQKKQILLISGISILVLFVLLLTLNFSKKLRLRNKELFKQNEELSKRWNELQGFYMKCTPPEDETKESKTLFQNIIKLFNDEKVYKRSDLNVNYIAKKLSSNVKYISNSIKDQTGMNFNTFINTYRIEDAKVLIKDPKSENLTMEAIAEECGFNNQTSFYQAFKKNTGLTPTQYRSVKAA